jgi:hypothetical protein
VNHQNVLFQDLPEKTTIIYIILTINYIHVFVLSTMPIMSVRFIILKIYILPSYRYLYLKYNISV